MNLTEFFNIVKKYGDGSFAFPLLEEFLTTRKNTDVNNFFDLYKNDSKLASTVDSKKYAKVVGTILEDHKSYGGDLNSITKSFQQNPDKMTISTYAVRNLELKEERTHKFTINVTGILLYDVVEKIYNLSKEMNYNLDMEIPAVKDQKSGLTDTITIYSSNNNLFNTIDFLQGVDKFKNSFGEQCPYYAQVSEGIAYDSYNEKLGKWNRELVGESVIEAMDNMLEKFIVNHPDLYGNASSVNYKHDRTSIIRSMMRTLREEGSDKDVYQIFNESLENTFKKNDIDPDNIYVSENVHEKFFGPRVRVEDVPPINGELTEEEIQSLTDIIQETTKASIEDALKEESNLSEETPGEEDSLEENDQKSDEFVLLNGTLPTIDLENEDVKIYGENNTLTLKPNADIPLNPLDYIKPINPTGSLQLLDEIDNLFSKEETSEKEESEKQESFFDEDKITLPSDEIPSSDEGETPEEKSEETPDDVSVAFGANMTIPEEEPKTPSEDVVSDNPIDEESHVENLIDKIFGSGELGEINIDEIDSEEVDFNELGAEESPSEELDVKVPIIEGSPAEESDIKDTLDAEEHEDQEEKSEDIASGPFSLLKDLMEQPEEQETKDTNFILGASRTENDGMQALKEFREKRAKEIKEMEEHARAELVKVEKNKENDENREDKIRKSAEKEEYLEGLLNGLGEESEEKASIISDDEKPMRPRIPKEKTEEEQALDNMLEALQNPVEVDKPVVVERQEIATYEHVASEEEQRLSEMEQRALEGPSGKDDYTTPDRPHRKSSPIEKSDAEKYLDEVLEKASTPGKNGEFNGFSENMVGIETTEPSALNPSDIFDEAISRAERDEETRSEAERLFDERVRALEAMNASRRPETTIEKEAREIVAREQVPSPEQERLSQMLEDALNPKDKEEFNGFNADIFTEDNQEITPSSLFGVSENTQKKYEVQAKERNKTEERMDSLLRGEYKEPPAVVIETPEPTVVSQKEVDEKEQAMDQMLKDMDLPNPPIIEETKETSITSYIPKENPHEKELDKLIEDALEPKDKVVPEREEVDHITYTHVKSEHEEALDKLMDSVLNPKPEEEPEFNGFSDTFNGDINYMEVVASADSLIGEEVEEAYKKQVDGMPSGEDYLEQLLANIDNPKQETTEERAEKITSSTPATNEEKSKEEKRLEDLFAASLIPQAPVIDEKVEKENGHIPSIPSEINAQEQELDEKLRKLDEGPEEPEFNGFDGIPLIGVQPEMVSGNQNLFDASLEEKIKQVAEMERNKSANEKRMDSLLSGEYQEEPAVKIETPEMVGATPLQTSVLEQAMNDQLEGLEETSPSALFSGINRASKDNFETEEKKEETQVEEVEEKAESEEMTASELFQGFDANMYDQLEDEMVASASDLFGDALSLGVSQIMSEDEEKQAYESHLSQMLGILDETKEKTPDNDELELPLKKDTPKEPDEKVEEEPEFNGFGNEVFFDDRSDEEKFNEAMSQVSITSLSSALLSDEERAALLDLDKTSEIDKDGKYDFIETDLNVSIIDEDGQKSTLLDYLEKNKVLDVLAPGNQVITLEGSMTSEEFICSKLIPTLLLEGNVNFQEFVSNNTFSVDNYNFGM